MASSDQFRSQCGRARATIAALAALGAVLILFAAAPAAANGGVKTVKCALPFTAGGPSFFCSGTHQILYTTAGFTNNNSTITAELVAFDELGNVLGSIPVHSGDLAQLASKVQPDKFKMTSNKNLHTVFAPIPMLRVTADDGVDKVTAYCSNIPLARVFEPDGTVVSASEGDVTHVLAAIPQVDPAHLVLTVDGVDILAGLGIGNAASCTPASPCGGNFLVGSNNVTVSNLVVDVGPINTLHRNTVSFDIAGLGCGGHLFAVNGLPLPGSRPANVAASCHKDAISDKGLSSGFAINLTKPTPQQTSVPAPVKVRGQVCSGLAIAGLNINGIDVPVVGQTLIPGNGTTTADTFKFKIKLSLPETNLAQDFASGDAAPGADAGSNLLIASATDTEGNRTFARRFYGTHTTLNPGVTAAALGNLGQTALEALSKKLNHVVAGAAPLPSTVQVDNAFLIGLSPAAIQQQFDKRCPDADAQFKTKAKAALEAISIPNVSVDPPCSCAADVGFTIGTVTFTGNVTCQVAFTADKFTVTIGLPTANIPIHGSGHCGDCVVGIGSETTVSGDLTLNLSNAQVKFDVTKDQLLNPTSPQPTVFVEGTTSTTGSIGVDTCEFPAGVCNFFLDVLAFITSGEWPDFTPDIDLSNVADFKNAIAASEPDPVKLAAIKIDEQKVANFDQTLSGQLTSVQINSNGILAGLRGSFATDIVDPEILGTPGALITQPPLPSLPILGASDAVIALSTDTINMLFASMTVAGKLKESCQPSGKTLGDLLPVDCDSLVNDASPIATALQQGVCHGIRLHDCESLTGPNTPIKQGACHGTRGDNCATILTQGNAVQKLLEKTTCQGTPNLNLRADQNILFCTRQDIPPRMALLSGGGALPVSTALRFKAMSVALILDRQGDDLDGTLDATPQCFATGAPRLGDCALYEACLDMNFKFDEQFVPPGETTTCGGLPGFKAVFKEVQILNRQAGVVCNGSGLVADDALLLDQTSSSDIITINLPEKARDASPPICMEGLSLGNFVTCGAPQLLAIGTGAFKDYMGVTCAITAAP